MPGFVRLCSLCILSVIGVCFAQWGNYPQWDDRYPGNKEKPYCPPDSPWPCWEPPFLPYDPIKVRIDGVGDVIGRSMMFQPNHYVNWFLGVPYARPPTYERRFRPPVEPGLNWDEKETREWDASYYRPACPQEIWKIDQRFYEIRNQSEDCLYMNIFQPNFTDKGDAYNDNYPVLVFVHGEDFKLGDSQLYPGHILAKKEVIVITFNYRLGALGFMSMMDANAPGNYGILDVVEVLEFIRKHIRSFRGDPDQVTIVGAGSGSAIVGLLLVSPKSKSRQTGRKLFHKAILMSGSDLCEWSVVEHIYDTDAREYTKALGRQVGCDPDYGLSTLQLIDCLRYKHFEELVNATGYVWRRYGSMAGPFGPVIDGLFRNPPTADRIVLPDHPVTLRNDGKFLKVPLIAGLTRDEGAFLVENITKDIIGLRMDDGLDPGTFRDILYKLMYRRRPLVKNTHEVVAALEYEYTFWAKPDNRTAVRQNLIDLFSDMTYGYCVDRVLKYHAAFTFSGSSSFGRITSDPGEPVWMYSFDHRSEYEPLPEWMGVPHGRDVEYLFGAPFTNDTLGNITGIVPYQNDWTILDKNISEFMQYMWVNFTKYGVPMTEWQRNVTWYEFYSHNLSFLHIHEFSWMDINYRQNHYAFWNNYYPQLSAKYPITTTPGPTPRPLVELQAATWSLTGAAIITLFVIGALGITLWRRSHRYS